MTDNTIGKDEALFRALNKAKRRKRRRTVFLVLFLLAAAAAGILYAVPALKGRVNDTINLALAEVQSYKVTRGSVSSVISGSGVLENAEIEELNVPYGVEITDMLVSDGDSVQVGDVIAEVSETSVLTAIASVQTKLDELDHDITKAKGDKVGIYLKAGMNGRVKTIYCSEGQDVAECMAEHGALAVLSIDGLMAVDFESSASLSGSVKVITPDGVSYDGKIEGTSGGRYTVTLTDNGPVPGDIAKICDLQGSELGEGELYIHSPIAVTGYAGRISDVSSHTDAVVLRESVLFVLSDTQVTANYDALLKSRRENEELLGSLVAIMRNGAVVSPISGTVSKVKYTEEDYKAAGAGAVIPTEYTLAELSPDVKMSVTVDVSENSILSLSLGQQAEVTIPSAGGLSITGEITEIHRVSESSGGSVNYSAVITLGKTKEMLAGMTAETEIILSSVDNTLLVPTAAIHRTSKGAYVFTEYTNGALEYSSSADVKIGISNSKFTEILSGLSEGDTVYYTDRDGEEQA